ncbi:MAG: AAA family ATPase [Nitrososphaerota archaeon]|nr:AAA family ATPase [Candidatus Bathyarchaeota archaeon]MDW8049159.1 AAA family ATPase [Nitrososphaerota archaeon]
MEEGEFLDQWWYGRPKLRKLFSPLLYFSSWQYRLWRFLRKPPEKRMKEAEKHAKRIRKRIDFPNVRKEDIVGGEENLNKVLLSAHYHIFRDPDVRRMCPVPPPKVFILKGGSGSGKTFFAEACQREIFEEGLKYGLLIHYASLKPENVYTMWYGRSAQQLGAFFQEAFQKPSVVLIDEFQAFGSRFSSVTEVGMEEKRVQTVFLEKIDQLQNKNYRCIVLICTSEYEAITETLRRRGVVGTIDLDAGINRVMLLEIAKRQVEKYHIRLKPSEVIEVLEESLRAVGNTRLTPADVVNAFQIVMTEKSRPLQRRIIERVGIGKPRKVDVGGLVTLNDFRAAAKGLKAYTSQEKTEAAKRAVNRIAPRERYSDVGGLHGIKEEVIKEISLALDPDLAVRAGYHPPKGFLFCGPPGTGKTLLAKAIAGENDVWFYNIDGPSILQGKYGDPEKTIRDIFEDARKNAPAIIFFDEIDSIAPKRGMHDPVVDRVVSQLLTEIDGFTPLTNVVVIGATNRAEILDAALLERFTRRFDFTYPKNRAEKMEVLQVHLRRYRDALEEGITTEDVLKIFEKRVLSPRKIADAVDDANRLRAKEIEACRKLLQAKAFGEEKEKEVRELFKADLERLCENLGISDNSPEFMKVLQEINPSNYPLSLFHFEKALQRTFDESVEEAQRMVQQTVRIEKPEVGKSYGLMALGDQGELGGLVGVTEVVVNPKGSGKVQVIGSEAGESILASAQDAFICINSISDWKFKDYDVYVELVTPAKGMEKQAFGPVVTRAPVSGPSAGLSIAVAMLSAFLGVEVDPTVVMTGAITARGEVWPVGGLDYRGMGKIEATLSDRFARKLLIPRYNYENLARFDTEMMLFERGIKIVPVQTFLEAAAEALIGFSSPEEILRTLKKEA